MLAGILLFAAALLTCSCFFLGTARAQTDEIQVYDASINNPGQFNVTFHNNFTPIGRKQPDFPGGVATNHTLNGVPEFAYGVNEWWELGAYLPVYSITGAGHALFDAVKLRSLFVVPHAEERTIFYGVNFELSYNEYHWDPTHMTGEVRPIIGGRVGHFDLIFNPILDTKFDGVKALDFVPAERLAYNLSGVWAVALEHYWDYGKLNDPYSLDSQSQTLFFVVDYKGQTNQVEAGIGHGFTDASDDLVLKLMIAHTF
jgi:hypothetical protein